MEVQFLGHAGIKIEDDKIIYIDPWLNDNPLAKIKAEDISKADYIIATHNHSDHVDDIPIISKNTNATVVSIEFLSFITIKLFITQVIQAFLVI